MESFAWLALLALLFALVFIYFILRQGRQREIVVHPEVDFELGQEIEPRLHHHLLREEDEAWLPRTYGEDQITLMVRDPHCLYAYWEFDATSLGEDHPSSLHLRLLKHDGRICQDFPVCDRVGSWYFHQVTPASRFVVTLGARGPDRAYRELLRSLPVMTPPEGPSSIVNGHYISALWDEGNLPSSPVRWQGGRP